MERQIQWPNRYHLTLTVCIPVYNQDITGLVYSLIKQTKLTNGFANIVVLDDHSETAFHQKNHFFQKCDLTTNIFMLVNLEPIFGFILEINSIPNYLHGHTVAAMCFNMGHLVKKVG